MNSRWRGMYEELGLTDKKTVGAGHVPAKGSGAFFRPGRHSALPIEKSGS